MIRQYWLNRLQFMIEVIGAFLFGSLFTTLILLSRIKGREAERQGKADAERARLEERIAAREQKVSELTEELAQRERLNERNIEELRTMEAQVSELSTRLDEERRSAVEKLAQFEETKTSLLDTFKALSADALRTNNQSFLDLAMQNLSKFQEGAKGDIEKRAQAIDELVRPLKDSLQRVDEKIDQLEKSRTSAYVSLHEQVKSLAETQMMLRSETGNLVTALRTPAVRGRWGEIQLRRVVELAGMLAHCDFSEQENLEAEGGRLRPDMVIKLPNGREIAVDAKVPIEAYWRAFEAANDELRVAHLKDHARQVRDHMHKLGQKKYWEHFDSPEFTVLFLSGEMFFGAALEHDPTLLEFGVERKVIIATPTTLIALLRAVYYGWRQEALAEHARAIRELGQELHDRLRTMTGHLVDVRKGLDSAVHGYNSFVSSFEKRVLVSARRFKELEVTEGKDIPDVRAIESAPVAAIGDGSPITSSRELPTEEPAAPQAAPETH